MEPETKTHQKSIYIGISKMLQTHKKYIIAITNDSNFGNIGPHPWTKYIRSLFMKKYCTKTKH